MRKMPYDALIQRITTRREVFGGKPIVRDMRIAVEHALAMLAAGDDEETILREYPDLEVEDIRACQIFAHFQASLERNHRLYELLAE